MKEPSIQGTDCGGPSTKAQKRYYIAYEIQQQVDGTGRCGGDEQKIHHWC